jgi:hypothetical protein
MVRAHRRSASDLFLRAAARGAILIGVAVVIGVILLQVVDKGGGGGGVGVTAPTSDTKEASVTATTVSGRPAAEVTVYVQNGSGVNQAAATLANELRGLGYAISGTGDAAIQAGTTVACVAGFEAEAEALAAAMGSGATVGVYPTPVPAGAETSSCIVTRGQ